MPIYKLLVSKIVIIMSKKLKLIYELVFKLVSNWLY